MRTEATQSDPDETVDDETYEGDVTRLASAAELADLARLRAQQPRRRNFLFGSVIVLLLGVLATLLAVLISRDEKSITWPGELTNDFNDARRLLFVEDETALLVYWPKSAQDVVTGDGTNLIDVVTAVGRDRTVPFHLRVTCQALTNGLQVTTRDSYERWTRERLKDKWSFEADGERLIFLNNAECGYPAWSVDYVRETAGHMFSGRALYIRHLDREIVVLRELPTSMRGRAEYLLNGYPCIAANLAAVRARFEIPARREPGRPSDLALEAYDALQNGFLAADWRRLDRQLRTVMLAAREEGDQRLLQNATLLYSTFRLKVQNWYVRECLQFKELNDKRRMRDMDAETRSANRTVIRRECARRLPDESDCRQRRIANDDWSLP